MISQISISSFHQLLTSTEEFAVIDPREELMFSRGHLFSATNMPLSRLELLIDAGVPDKSIRIVLCDDGEGTADKAVTVLEELGFSDVRVLDGGLPAWALTGGAVFSGMNVPSKAFGEVVENKLNTPTISASTLHEKLKSGEKVHLLDARPLEEHREYCVPGSICCPSAELIFRASSLKIEPDSQIVVHCAGRTRSIIGAQTLIDSGMFKNVVSLCNGTPAWEFEGFDLETDDDRALPFPTEEGRCKAVETAKRIRKEWNIPALSPQKIEQWRTAGGTRYLFDVRSEEEFLNAHLKGSRHIAGGQLLQTTEKHIVVKNSQILLIDTDGVRATTTAMWLRRMGWNDVAVAEIPQMDFELESGANTPEDYFQLQMIDIDEA